MEKRKVLESDLEVGQEWEDKDYIRVIDYINRGHVVYFYKDGPASMGCASFDWFIKHYTVELKGGPEPKSWAEKPKDVYCELVWDGGSDVSFSFKSRSYCWQVSPGDIIADGYRLLNYTRNKDDDGDWSVVPYCQVPGRGNPRKKYAKLVKDEVTL